MPADLVKDRLVPAEQVEVISVVDNLLEPPGVSPPPAVKPLSEWTPDPERARSPRGEHGLSLLVRVRGNFGTCTILFDAAGEPGSVADNAERMGLDLSPVEAIVLSHQHWDHTGGLASTLRALNARELPVIVHLRAFLKRGWRDPDKPEAKMRRPRYDLDREEIEAAGGRIVEARGPHLLCDDGLLVTGEIPRQTDFEVGMPHEWVLEDGEWRHDPRVLDDRSIVVHVRHRGLVVISGCAHSGIVNTVRYAQQLTGVQRVAAILGGFHLVGPNSEHTIEGTVAALKELNPELLAPSHCTGWQGRLALAQAFPAAFVPNTVGNLYRIGG